MPNYPEGKFFVLPKLLRFERKSSSIVSPKTKVIDIVKAAKPKVLCLFYLKVSFSRHSRLCFLSGNPALMPHGHL